VKVAEHRRPFDFDLALHARLGEPRVLLRETECAHKLQRAPGARPSLRRLKASILKLRTVLLKDL
jgi:hypothetical protein